MHFYVNFLVILKSAVVEISLCIVQFTTWVRSRDENGSACRKVNYFNKRIKRGNF